MKALVVYSGKSGNTKNWRKLSVPPLSAKIANKVHPVPLEISHMKLAAMKIHIDTQTEEQQEYVSSWQEGT